MLKRYGIYNKKNEIVNVISLENEGDWSPPKNCKIIQDDNVQMGDTVISNKVVYKPTPESEDPDLDYSEKRRREFPPSGDQLDVIWKQFNSMRLNGVELDQETDNMLGQILAIKKKYPKE